MIARTREEDRRQFDAVCEDGKRWYVEGRINLVELEEYVDLWWRMLVAPHDARATALTCGLR